MINLKIKYQDPTSLRPRARNPRTHSPKQISQIVASIEQFGFVNPVLVDAKNRIIAGHGRVEAAKLLGLTEIPTISVDGMTDAQIRAYVIADNKIAENAGWDPELLALELLELSVEPNFDVTVTGFETGEIDFLIGEKNNEDLEEAETLPDVDRSVPAVSRLGDAWNIGPHRLLCADARVAASYQALLGAEKAQMVLIDAPYNVHIAGHVSGLGRVKHREFAMASGEMTVAEFTNFLKTTITHLVAFSANGSIHYLFMDWRHIREVLDGATAYSELKNICVWAKTNAGMGSFYRSQHEFVFVFKNGTGRHINNVELGRFGRRRSNVWTYAGVNSFGKERDAELAMHPTVKPLALVSEAILDCSRRGGIVLDVFAGSGTTLIAAEKAGRRGYGMEIDPHYVDTIIRRFAKVYGLKAIHAETGKTFEQLSAKRTTSEGPPNVKSKKAATAKPNRAKAVKKAAQKRKGR